MDSHQVGRGRGGIEMALARVQARTIVLSLERDILFPLSDQIVLHRGIEDAVHEVIHSNYGHDGFLIETGKIGAQLQLFLEGVKIS